MILYGKNGKRETKVLIKNHKILITQKVVIGSGATGHGDNIIVMGNGSATAIHPHYDSEVDLGSSSYSFKDSYIDGTAYIGIVQTSSIVPTGIFFNFIKIQNYMIKLN